MTSFAYNAVPIPEEEWDYSKPVFESGGPALEYMDEQEREALAELEAEARARMDAAANDPRTQNYFMRLDKHTVIQDEREYVQCQVKGVKIKIVSYGTAMHLLKVEDARKKAALKNKAKKKAAKKSRKRNR